MKLILIVMMCLSVTACSSWGKKQKGGTAVGAAAGGAAGAVLGNQTGKSAQGAAIGAAIGGTLGNVIGRRMDQQAKELDKVAESQRTDEGIVTKLKGDILFDTGQANLKPEAAERLGQLSDIIKKYPEDRITIIGHTDSTGSMDLNQNLSEQRANAVRVLMLEKGIPPDTVSIVGMGEAQPVGDNDSNRGRAQNRRVELQISADPQSIRQ